jgi:hypothetical protein
MIKWIIGVVVGILVVAAIGTGIALAVLPGEAVVVTQPPGPDLVPSNLTANGSTDPLSITIAWEQAIPSDVTAVLQRSPSGDNDSWLDIATFQPGTTNYIDSDIDKGQIYFYRVQASDEAGGEGISPVVSAVAGS